MIIKYIALIFGAIFEIYSIYMYMSAFSEKKNINKILNLIVFSIVSLLQILAAFIFSGTILLICSLLISYIISQLFNTKQYVKLILSITIVVISVAGEMLVSGILMIINSSDFETLSQEPNIYSLGVLLSKFFVFVLVIIIRIGKNKLSIENLETKYLIVLSILPITTVFLIVLMYQIMLILDNNQLKIMFIIASMLLILSNVITFEVVKNQNKLAKSEYELNLLKNSVLEQTKHYEELKFSQDEIRQMRHNMKSICIATIAELKEGRTENALEQLQENIDIIEKSSKIIDTGHPSIDSTIENKLNRCAELNIHTNISYQYKETININEIEIAVIVGNILDNAIEASQKVECYEKEIWGSITVDKQNIIINIKNTAVSFNNLKTSKADKKSHGYGLKSISHIAKKYNGFAKFSFSDNTFKSYVILEN